MTCTCKEPNQGCSHCGVSNILKFLAESQAKDKHTDVIIESNHIHPILKYVRYLEDENKSLIEQRKADQKAADEGDCPVCGYKS